MNITQDLVDEILSRLPVKSLARFNLVCKDWYSNIHSHSFIAKHLKNQTTNDKLLFYVLHYLNYNPTISIFSDREKVEEDDNREDNGNYSGYNDNDDDSQRHMPGHYSTFSEVEIVATCNGLVCIYSKEWPDYQKFKLEKFRLVKSIVLWNPATRDFKTLPPFPGAIRSSGDLVGFGYDLAHDDYKVIRILQLLKEEYRYWKPKQDVIQIKIYSLSSNSWREFDCSDLSPEIVTPANSMGTIFGKEKFCWLAVAVAGDSSEKKGMILSFDMGKEVFQKTPLPSVYEHLEGKKYVTELFQLHDSIALVHYEKRDTEKTFAIWTVKKLDREGNSWIKLANVGPLSRIGRPVGFWKCKDRNNFLFLFDGISKGKLDKIIKCVYMNNREQIKKDRSMTMKVKNIKNMVPVKVQTYVETLVSANRDRS